MEAQSSKRRHLKGDEWGELLNRFRCGGESVTGFCRREGVSANSFRRWRERLTAKAPGVPKPMSAAVAQADAGFVELGSIGVTAAAPATRLELTLDLGGGVTLHVVRG